MTVLLIVSSLAVTACSNAQDVPQVDIARLTDSIEDAEGNTVTLGSAYEDFDFDMVVIGCPFTEPAAITDHLDEPWDGVTSLELQDDSKGSLVFVENGAVVATSVFPRTSVNLCVSPEAGGTVLAPDTPIPFTQELNTDGSSAWTAPRLP